MVVLNALNMIQIVPTKLTHVMVDWLFIIYLIR